MMSKKTIRIICIILAILMTLSVFAVLFQSFAASVVPNTGVEDYIVPLALVAGGCLILIVVLLILPKLKKKTKEDDNNK